MFTDFLLFTCFAVVAALVGLLAARWTSVPPEAMRPSVAPLAVAVVTAALIALGFLVI